MDCHSSHALPDKLFTQVLCVRHGSRKYNGLPVPSVLLPFGNDPGVQRAFIHDLGHLIQIEVMRLWDSIQFGLESYVDNQRPRLHKETSLHEFLKLYDIGHDREDRDEPLPIGSLWCGRQTQNVAIGILIFERINDVAIRFGYSVVRFIQHQ
jgi:hypothetical protein